MARLFILLLALILALEDEHCVAHGRDRHIGLEGVKRSPQAQLFKREWGINVFLWPMVCLAGRVHKVAVVRR